MPPMPTDPHERIALLRDRLADLIAKLPAVGQNVTPVVQLGILAIRTELLHTARDLERHDRW